MPLISDDLLTRIRDRFAHVDICPFQGERVFFENAGGALTLKSVVETSGFTPPFPITRAARTRPVMRLSM